MPLREIFTSTPTFPLSSYTNYTTPNPDLPENDKKNYILSSPFSSTTEYLKRASDNDYLPKNNVYIEASTGISPFKQGVSIDNIDRSTRPTPRSVFFPDSTALKRQSSAMSTVSSINDDEKLSHSVVPPQLSHQNTPTCPMTDFSRIKLICSRIDSYFKSHVENLQNPDILTPFIDYEDAIRRLLPYHLFISHKSHTLAVDSFIPETSLKIISKVNSKILQSDYSHLVYEKYLNLKCIIESQRISNVKLDKNLPFTSVYQGSQQTKSVEPLSTSKPLYSYPTEQPTEMMYAKQHHVSRTYTGALPRMPQQVMYSQPASLSQNIPIPAAYQRYPLEYIPKTFHGHQASPSYLPVHSQYLSYNFQGYSSTPLPYQQFQNSPQFFTNRSTPTLAKPPSSNGVSAKKQPSDILNNTSSMAKRKAG